VQTLEELIYLECWAQASERQLSSAKLLKVVRSRDGYAPRFCSQFTPPGRRLPVFGRLSAMYFGGNSTWPSFAEAKRRFMAVTTDEHHGADDAGSGDGLVLTGMLARPYETIA